jgi:hypothetical protein
MTIDIENINGSKDKLLSPVSSELNSLHSKRCKTKGSPTKGGVVGGKKF